VGEQLAPGIYNRVDLPVPYPQAEKKRSGGELIFADAKVEAPITCLFEIDQALTELPAVKRLKVWYQSVANKMPFKFIASLPLLELARASRLASNLSVTFVYSPNSDVIWNAYLSNH